MKENIEQLRVDLRKAYDNERRQTIFTAMAAHGPAMPHTSMHTSEDVMEHVITVCVELMRQGREQTQLEDDLVSIFTAYGFTPKQTAKHVLNLLRDFGYPLVAASQKH